MCRVCTRHQLLRLACGLRLGTTCPLTRAAEAALRAEKLIYAKASTADAHPGISYALFLHVVPTQTKEEEGTANADA